MKKLLIVPFLLITTLCFAQTPIRLMDKDGDKLSINADGSVNAVISGGGSGDFFADGSVPMTGDITLENAEVIDNGTDGTVCLQGGGGTNNEDWCFDLETTANIVDLSSTTGASLRYIHGTVSQGGAGGLRVGRTATQYWHFTGDAKDQLMYNVGTKPSRIGNLNATTFSFATNDIVRFRVSGDGAAAVGMTSPSSLTAGPWQVLPIAEEEIAGAATITANCCGTIKQISTDDLGAVTTDTTNTFTAPAAANNGCCMDVINTGGTDAITLDSNAKFVSAGGANVVLGVGDTVRVCSNASIWYQIGDTGNN